MSSLIITFNSSSISKSDISKISNSAVSFCKSFDLNFKIDRLRVDKIYSLHLHVNVKGSQQVVLPVMSALFSFAEFHKLSLVNQYFYSEE